MTCHACGAQLSSTARFCHKCGATVATVGATGWRAGLPWALAGAALGALIAVVAMRASAPSPARNDEPAAPFASSGGGRPPDISQMSPEERANRLFNRVMMLAEAGKQDSVHFFLPMALASYSQLPALDADARYHVGLLQLAGGDVGAALAQADTMQRAVPNHLFIYVLRAHAYQAQGNTAQEQRAYADFLRHEQAELAVKRPEYDDHREALTNFHSEALRQAQSPRRPTS
jgi:tetratricopeptide (TPR) repeat protein